MELSAESFIALSQSVQFSSVQFFDRSGRRGDVRDDSAEILFQSSLQEALGHIWHGQGCPVFDNILPAFPLATTSSSTLQGAAKDGF